MIQNKVKWQREEGNTSVPYLFENHDNRWLWVRYNRSKVFIPDKPHFSKGYLTFNNAIKQGYKMEFLK